MTPGTGEIFLTFLRLGLTSFGGPVAHLGYFHDEFVNRRRWMTAEDYADLVALCQFLPGPASSQVGLAIGWIKGGYAGSVAAWCGFTLPSAIALIVFAFGVMTFGGLLESGFLQGLKIAAVAIVAQAVWQMSRSLCPDAPRRLLALAAAILAFFWTGPAGQVVVIAIGGLFGRVFLDAARRNDSMQNRERRGTRAAAIFLALFFLLLIGLPVLAAIIDAQTLLMTDRYFRAGSLVFGGGHVVLPLLQSEVVTTGWVSKDAFLAGYGAAQAVPGPLFTFSAYLGAVASIEPNGWQGGMIALLAIFLPSFLLIYGALPFWNMLRQQDSVQSALLGINAAVVGLLLAAFYDPVWRSGILTISDFAIALLAFGALTVMKAPSWLIVIGCGAATMAIEYFF